MWFQLRGLRLSADDAPLLVTAFSPGAPELRSNDLHRPLTDGVIFGRDQLGMAKWAFEVACLGSSRADTEQLVMDLATAWAPARGALEVLPLTYTVGERSRVVYGRPGVARQPRGWALEDAETVELEFRLADPLAYGTEVNSLTLGVVPASAHGIRVPSSVPMVWSTRGAPQSRLIEVGGTAPAPVTVTLHGPLEVGASVDVGGVRVETARALAWDEVLTVDGRAMTVTRQDGASVAGWLSPRTRLTGLRVPPGTHEVVFSGRDVTGTATATVEWRDAWQSL